MGEEPFYSPREDLEALIAAIESLEVAMDTLDTSVGTLTTAFMLPESQTKITGTYAFEAAYEQKEIYSAVVSADEDVFLHLARLRLNTVVNPWIHKDAEVTYVAEATSGLAMFEYICNGTQPAFPLSAAKDLWVTSRYVQIPNFLVAAGDTLTLTVQNWGVALAATAVLDMWYRKLV